MNNESLPKRARTWFDNKGGITDLLLNELADEIERLTKVAGNIEALSIMRYAEIEQLQNWIAEWLAAGEFQCTEHRPDYCGGFGCAEGDDVEMYVGWVPVAEMPDAVRTLLAGGPGGLGGVPPS